MKRLKQWTLLLPGLLLTAAGAALPYAASFVQDARVENVIESQTFHSVSLTLLDNSGIQEVLRLLAGSTSDLYWNGKTNLTAAEATAAAEEALRQMNKNGITSLTPEILLQYGYQISAEPHIIMSMDESNLSAVIWVCRMGTEPDNWLFIDDETGKLVRVFLLGIDIMNSEVDSSSYPNSSVNSNISFDSGGSGLVVNNWSITLEAAEKRAMQWVEFLSAHYNMELTLLDDPYFTSGYCEFTVHFDAGDAPLELTVEGEWFNP